MEKGLSPYRSMELKRFHEKRMWFLISLWQLNNKEKDNAYWEVKKKSNFQFPWLYESVFRSLYYFTLKNLINTFKYK